MLARSLCWSVLAVTTAAVAARAGTATYRATFQSTWSAATHPVDFPAPAAHFSGLIGGTHHAAVHFWRVGELASPGIENMAETGGKSPLNGEVNAAIAAGSAYSLISGGGLATTPAEVSVDFEIAETHPLVSLVTMIAPSPDWFVGVDSLPLVSAGRWRERVVVDLFPHDAGTDSGTNHQNVDIDTQPRAAISPITGFPYTGTPRLGTFTFELLGFSPALTGDVNGDGRVDLDDFGVLKSHFGQSPAGAAEGDLDGDSTVDLADFGVLKASFGRSVVTPAPEPATMGLLLLGGCAWLLGSRSGRCRHD
jgi:hypothetical protein